MVLAGAGVRTGVDPGLVDIVDVVPAVLAAWGLPIWEAVDGRVINEALSASLGERRVALNETRHRDYTTDDAEEVLDRMRGLGYVG